jgi:flagellar basal-body rod modification protein FlgD
MTMIPSTPATTPSAAAGAASATPPSNAALKQLEDSQTFLKLLVAQLKYQNPDNPVDPSQFISQTAQLTEVQTIVSLQSQFSQQLSMEQTVASTSLIGKQITAQTAGGNVSGVVSDVTLSPTGAPMLDVNGQSIALSSVTNVGSATAGTTGTDPTGAAGTTGTDPTTAPTTPTTTPTQTTPTQSGTGTPTTGTTA